MKKTVFKDNRAIYYDTKKSKLIAKRFFNDEWGNDIFCCHAKFLYLTGKGNWFFYVDEYYPDPDCQDDYGSRDIEPCGDFEAQRFMVESGRMDLAKKYGLREEEA